jgi:hypothetical protein
VVSSSRQLEPTALRPVLHLALGWLHCVWVHWVMQSWNRRAPRDLVVTSCTAASHINERILIVRRLFTSCNITNFSSTYVYLPNCSCRSSENRADEQIDAIASAHENRAADVGSVCTQVIIPHALFLAYYCFIIIVCYHSKCILTQK